MYLCYEIQLSCICNIINIMFAIVSCTCIFVTVNENAYLQVHISLRIQNSVVTGRRV